MISRAGVLIQLGIKEGLEPSDMEPGRKATTAGKEVDTS
jgi:hypothetical protein